MKQILIGNRAISPPVLLSPMAGITDVPFRNLVSKFGAGLVVSEMVASQEILVDKGHTWAKTEIGFNAGNTAVQIAGRDAYEMAECARLCVDKGAEIIDINMGCPAKQVTQGYSGSALMKEPDFALTLIEAVVNAVDVPVTLKTRLGWDDDMLNAAPLSKRAADAGVQMITIHGRTRCQFYKGSADWQAIRAVKQAVDVPVIANGDIVDAATAKQALHASGADGVMVGRGAYGKPWILAQIASELFGTPKPIIPTGQALVDLICEHYTAIEEFYGSDLANRVARKHLGWYMDGLNISREFRREIQTEKDNAKVLRLITELAHCEPLAA